MEVAYPYRVDSRGRTAQAKTDQHIRELIEQVLFTAPGERVNRPSFGTGLMQLVFAPNGSELATATQFLMQGALQQWLGDLIQVEGVAIDGSEATLRVTVQYMVRRNQQRQTAELVRGGALMGSYFCCVPERRAAVRGSAALNGIDFLEVADADAPTPAERQRLLHVHFLRSPAPAGITTANVQIVGGDRIRDLQADGVSYEGDVLVVHVSTPGDFSTYCLRLVRTDANGLATEAPYAGLDPLLSAVSFSFKAECLTDFDCQPINACVAQPSASPEINYLGKDYASFRQLMLDRITALNPDWQERNAADLDVALVELLAYVGDYLSYRQDAVATEAYLGTARRRVSVRRHARLVDYLLHDGRNARVWVVVEVAADDVVLAKGTQLFTGVEGQTASIAPGSPAYVETLAAAPVVFETLHDARLFTAHNRLTLYTWGDKRCWLPKGATAATLTGHLPNVDASQVVLFEEVLGPQTAQPGDADPMRRHAVRLTKVTAGSDPLGNEPVAVTEIAWAPEDALPFALCISTQIAGESGNEDVTDVSVVRANVVLADHGMTITGEALGAVPNPTLFLAPTARAAPCQNDAPAPIPPRFQPRLKQAPLTFAPPYDDSLAASDAVGSSLLPATPWARRCCRRSHRFS
jgi:phage baseplate assembly protein W